MCLLKLNVMQENDYVRVSFAPKGLCGSIADELVFEMVKRHFLIKNKRVPNLESTF